MLLEQLLPLRLTEIGEQHTRLNWPDFSGLVGMERAGP